MLVEFGILNPNLIFLVFFPALFPIRRLFHNGDEKPIFEFFTNYLGYLCGGIIYSIKLCLMKKNRRANYDENKTDKNQELNEKDNDKGLNSKNPVKAVELDNPSAIDEDKNDFKRSTLKKYGFISLLICIYLFPLFLDSYCSSRDDLNFKTSSSMS